MLNPISTQQPQTPGHKNVCLIINRARSKDWTDNILGYFRMNKHYPTTSEKDAKRMCTQRNCAKQVLSQTNI